MNTSMQNPSFTPNPDLAGAETTNDSSRCQYRFANGKRCRLPGSKLHLGLCSHHFSQSNPASPVQPFNDSQDLSADLLPDVSEFASANDVASFLFRLLSLVTKGRISPRRASVLAFITSQLLHSHRSVLLENKAIADQPQEFIFDMPRPNRD